MSKIPGSATARLRYGIWLVTLVTVIPTASVLGQTPSHDNIRGIRSCCFHLGGILGWGQSETPGTDVGPRVGFSAGLQVGYGLSNVLSVQGELLYAWKEYSVEDATADAHIGMAFLELPLSVKLRVPGRRYIRPFVLMGASMAFPLSCRVNGTIAGATTDLPCIDAVGGDGDNEYNAFVGAGIELRPRSGHYYAAFDLRFSVGLRPVNAAVGLLNVRRRALTLVWSFSPPMPS